MVMVMVIVLVGDGDGDGDGHGDGHSDTSVPLHYIGLEAVNIFAESLGESIHGSRKASTTTPAFDCIFMDRY